MIQDITPHQYDNHYIEYQPQITDFCICGNGLGLYIVASVLDSLKLAYSLEPMQKPLGMRFTITF